MLKLDSTLWKNLISLGINKYSTLLFRYLGILYLVWVIDVRGIGVISVFRTYTAYLIVAINLGFLDYGIREVARARENLSRTVAEITWSRLYILLLLIPFLVYFLVTLPGDGIERWMLFIFFLQIPVTILMFEWACIGLERMSILAKASFLGNTLNLLLLFLFVKGREGMVIVPAAQLAGIAVMAAYYYFALADKLRWEGMIPVKTVMARLRNAVPITLTTFSVEILSSGEVLILSWFVSFEAIGSYRLASTLYLLFASVKLLICQALYPRISSFVAKGGTMSREILFKGAVLLGGTGVVIGAFMFFASGWVTRLAYMGKADALTALLLGMLGIIIPLDFLNHFLYTYFLAYKREKSMAVILATASGLLLLTGTVFVKNAGILGIVPAKAVSGVFLLICYLFLSGIFKRDRVE
ncbi:MAG: oligosaccharide flippase family protein [Candidatus Omnitrophica bacterium]|nr:oligosaccharide flippase family protein [Candidatus Omnitrophota bacterium]